MGVLLTPLLNTAENNLAANAVKHFLQQLKRHEEGFWAVPPLGSFSSRSTLCHLSRSKLLHWKQK